MSGVEAIAVLGVISAVIGIVGATKQVYDAATNAEGLPENFREVAGRLPIVGNILASAEQRIRKGDVDEDSCKGVKPVIVACQEKAEKLNDLFKKVIPGDGASRKARYFSAVRTLGKGNEVEKLMKGMLEDIQLLACERGMDIVTRAEQEQIVKAITEQSSLSAIAQNILVSHGSEEDEAQACLKALFLTDPNDDWWNLIQGKGERVDGTCEWIRSNELYKSWLHSQSQLLWLSGGPGKGKTMLSIFLSEELRLIQNVSFLQYFCDNKDDRRNTAVTIIRGLLFQLLQLRPKFIDYIIPSFKLRKESLFTMSSFETLWKIFETMICDRSLGTTYCILDGLDECDEASLEVLLKKLRGLFSTKSSEYSVFHLNLVVLSRDIPDFIPVLLSSYPRIRLDPDADSEINNDIHRFIEVKVDDLSVYRQYPEPLRVYVKDVFHSRANGTFLWVGIVAEQLRKYKATQVEKALDLFPSGLDELYTRMLLQIDKTQRETAAKILRWVVMAVRPLSLSELSAAIETAVIPSTMFNSDEKIRDQVSYCGYFLTIKEDEVGFIHQSAKDYLLRRNYDENPELDIFRIDEDKGNLEIVRKCLQYLQNGALAGGPVSLERTSSATDTSHLRKFPLLSYAALHWPVHARCLARSEDVFDLSLPFYAKKSLVRESWLKTYWATDSGLPPPNPFPLLHLASKFGILPLAENLVLKKRWIDRLKLSLDLNKRDGFGWIALRYAASGGYEAVVRLLLEKGADVNARGKNEWIALMSAAIAGHEAVVRLLLEKGADVNAKDNLGWTALICAASRGHEAIVQLLLEKGADVNAKEDDGSTALIYVAIGGHEAIVQLLLEKGADVNAKDNYGSTALKYAADEGHEAVVRLLLEKGADVNARGKKGWTALMSAAIRGREAVVQLLLEKGADVNAKDDDGWTALMFAAGGGHEAVVQLLLEKGQTSMRRKTTDG